jgi:hypothetical protein
MPRAKPKSKSQPEAETAKKLASTRPRRKVAVKRRTAHASSIPTSVLTSVFVEPTPLASSSFSLATVSFEDALQLTPLFELTTETIRLRFESKVRSELISAGVITANAVVAVDQSTLAVTFTHNGVRGFARGGFRLMRDAAGREIPVLTNASGRIVSQARVATQLASRAAALGAIVVGAAHLVSGADLAARTKEMQRDVRFLVAVRTHDKLGRLEAIYSHARELLAGPRSPEIDLEIFRLTRDLAEVRAQWRRDVHAKLERLESPTEKTGILDWLSRKFVNGAAKDAKKLHASTADALTELRWIDFSLALQYALSTACHREQPFLRLTLPDEVRALHGLGSLVKEKTEFLVHRGDEVDPSPLLNGIKAMADGYALLSMPAQSLPTNSPP